MLIPVYGFPQKMQQYYKVQGESFVFATKVKILYNDDLSTWKQLIKITKVDLEYVFWSSTINNNFHKKRVIRKENNYQIIEKRVIPQNMLYSLLFGNDHAKIINCGSNNKVDSLINRR